MNNPREDKVKHRLSTVEAAGYLRQLADALEQGRIALRSEELELEGDVKVTQALKTKSGKATLKINLKIIAPMPAPAQGGVRVEAGGFVEITPHEDEPGERDDNISYKQLKKALAQAFANLKRARKQETMPGSDEVAAFAEQGRRMCSFDKAEYGPENYPRFLAALDQLEAAVAAGEGQALDAALSELSRCRSECHDKYK